VAVAVSPQILARGPWTPAQVHARWADVEFQPAAEVTDAADVALESLRARSSPSHDGLAARLADFSANSDVLRLELQPARWALRLLPELAAGSLAVLCLVRAADGSWLAGRRASWLATWPGRWALGAGGSVEVGENPAEAMARELREEWSVEPVDLMVEALVRLPSELVMLVGQTRLSDGAVVTPDPEHDEFAWWPAALEQWPEHADEPLRRMAAMLAAER
jgi:ADP-ribose pyrophosphatase YjhB (NUDIX family)